MTLRNRVLTAALVLPCICATSQAGPLIATVSKDTELQMTAVIGGRWSDTPATSLESKGPFSLTEGWGVQSGEWSFGKIGENWNVWGRIIIYSFFESQDDDYSIDEFRGERIEIEVEGQHMVAPHDGEAAPNPLQMTVWHGNLTGTSFMDISQQLAFYSGFHPPAGQDGQETLLTQSIVHPAGDHFDTMTLTVYDLNGDAPGFFSSDRQLAVSVKLRHVPEPTMPYLLFLGGLVMLKRRKTGRISKSASPGRGRQ